MNELDKKMNELKQRIKGEENEMKKKILTKTLDGLLKQKVGNGLRQTPNVTIGVQAEKISKYDDIWKWSNPDKVAENAKKYLGNMAVVFRSIKPKKKYMIFDPNNNKWVYFGEMGMEDFTKHQDEKRRENYLARATNIKGNWKNNRYSANNLSINILWNG